MRVSIRELRQATDKLFDHVESLGVKEVEIPDDYYWSIPSEQLYDPTIEPVSPSLGQLSSDWQDLEMIAKGDAPPVALGFRWLAAVLRAISDHVIG